VAGRLERGEIRFYRFRAPDKQRPVLILTRPAALEYLSSVTIAPITSTMRGVPTEVEIGPDQGMKQPCVVNLHNVVTVAREGLGRRLGQLDGEHMSRVCAALAFAIGCDA
jgi:mRNA interferase MazF